jgi:pimeloyl-ACP methyl ester carboxylesterase
VQGGLTDVPGRFRLPAEELGRRKACFRDLTEAVIPQAGHMLHHDEPERLAQVVESFLAR